MAFCRIAGRRGVISRALRARTHGWCLSNCGIVASRAAARVLARCSVRAVLDTSSIICARPPRALPCSLLTPLVATRVACRQSGKGAPGALG